MSLLLTTNNKNILIAGNVKYVKKGFFVFVVVIKEFLLPLFVAIREVAQSVTSW